jgi:prolyl oligopeptidase
LPVTWRGVPQRFDLRLRHHYPVTATTNQVDVYHGVTVNDPYRWLEDDHSAATKAWVEAQNQVTFGYLDRFRSARRSRTRLTKLWNFERYGVPSKEGGRYFFSKNDGLQNQSVLYTLRSLDPTPKVLLDPNKLSADGTVAFAASSSARTAILMAYGMSVAGSDWQEWRCAMCDGADLPDVIKWVKFSGASWTKDGSGFFTRATMSRRKPRSSRGELFPQALLPSPRHAAERGQADLSIGRTRRNGASAAASRTTGGISHHMSGRARTRRIACSTGFQEARRASGRAADGFRRRTIRFIDNDGPVFWFKTDLNAPRGIASSPSTSAQSPQRANWKEIIPAGRERCTGVE